MGRRSTQAKGHKASELTQYYQLNKINPKFKHSLQKYIGHIRLTTETKPLCVARQLN